jgi:hypothetical protein
MPIDTFEKFQSITNLNIKLHFMNKKFYLVALIFGLYSCQKEISEKISPDKQITQSLKFNLKKEFGSAFSKALVQSKELRDVIREEAIKQFDNDYDVLYENIKDKKIGAGTINELISQFYENKSDAELIAKELPLLTIFVPELPENSFSAAKWNTSNEIPEVAINLPKSNDVFMFKADGSDYILDKKYAPAFPVVVIKENERIKVKNSSSKAESDGRSFVTFGNKEYTFLSDYFDAATKPINTNSLNQSRITPFLDPKVINAYNIYLGTTGWQRDYIYYGITPTNPNGPFDFDYKETITSFKLSGPNAPLTTYAKLSDQSGDPTINGGGYLPNPNNIFTEWTGGNYEFKIRVLFNAKNGLGNDFETYYPVSPYALFKLTYSKKRFGLGWLYTLINAEYNPTPVNMNLQLFKWDIADYASTIRIDVEETDPTETITESETTSSKFAANFGIDITTGTKTKFGLKFGASLEIFNQSTFTRVTQLGNDKLGSVIVDFADKVVLGRTPDLQNWVTQDYSSGYYTLSIEPTKVQ